MRSSTIISIFFLWSSFSFAQSYWMNLASGWANDNIAFENDFIWVPTNSGLIKVNKSSNELEAVFQPWNSPMIGQDVNVVEVDDEGTKWIGTKKGGLYSFDDNDWEQFYALNTGDTLIEIENIKIADNGDVWFFSMRNENSSHCLRLFQYNGDTFKRHDQHFPQAAWGADCSPALEDFEFNSSGELWVADQFGLYFYDGIDEVLNTFDSLNSPLLENESIIQIEIDASDHLWVGTRIPSGSIYYRVLKYDGSVWTIEQNISLGYCSQLFEDHENNIWFESQKENGDRDFARFDGTQWTFYDINDLPDIPDFGGGYDPALMTIDASGKWWFKGSLGEHEPRIFSFDGSDWIVYSTKILPIAGPYFTDMLFDCNKDTWLSSIRKLNKLESGTWLEFDLPIDDGLVSNMALDEMTCEIWICIYDSEDYDLIKYGGNTFEGFDPPGDIFQVKAQEGIIWVAGSEGLGKYENGNWLWFDDSNSPLGSSVYKISFDPQGDLWIIDSSDGMIRFDGNSSWQIFNSSNTPMTTNPTWVFVDQSGVVWFNQLDKLGSFNGVEWEFYTLPSTLNYHHHMLGMVEDHLHNYWIWMHTEGVLYWDGENFIHYNIENSDLGSHLMEEIKIDPYGNKWMRQIGGFTIFNENYINYKYIPRAASVHGTLFFDDDQTGVFNPDVDIKLPGRKVLLLPDSTQSFTSSGGYYSFYPENGVYQVQHAAESPFVNTSDSVLNFELNFENIDDLNFGVWTDELGDSIDVGIIAGPTVCDQLMNVWITLTNHNLEPVSGFVETTFDGVFSLISAFPSAENITGNTVVWTYEDLSFNESYLFKMELAVPGVDFIDDWFDFHAVANAVENNQIIVSDEDIVSSQVLCSFDPNDKIGRSVGEDVPPFSLLEDPLEYTIRFQNLGSYTAFDIVIKDTIDPKLNLSTLRIIASSHEVNTTLEPEGILTFRFEGIDLPPEEQDYLGSQGFVKYQIDPLPGLSDPTIILNTASIYFDFNPPIVTNTTENILVDSLPVTSISIVENKSAVLIYPNPSTSDFWIEWQNTEMITDPWRISVFDVSGKLLQQWSSTQTKHKINIPEQGFYFIGIEKDGLLFLKKAVVVK